MLGIGLPVQDLYLPLPISQCVVEVRGLRGQSSGGQTQPPMSHTPGAFGQIRSLWRIAEALATRDEARGHLPGICSAGGRWRRCGRALRDSDSTRQVTTAAFEAARPAAAPGPAPGSWPAASTVSCRHVV